MNKCQCQGVAVCKHRDKDFFKKKFKNKKQNHEENTNIFDFYAYDGVITSNK